MARIKPLSSGQIIGVGKELHYWLMDLESQTNTLFPIADVPFLVLTASTSLTQERVFTPGLGLDAVDSGAGLAYTLNVDVTELPTNDSLFLVLTADAILTNERVFTLGNGLDAVDSGAGAAYTVTVDETELNHNLLGNLAVGDVHTHYFILAGRAGGQIAYGGTGSGDDLYLYSTAHATKGTIFLNDQISSTVTKSDPVGVWTGQLFLTELTATVDYVSQGRGLQFQSSLYPAVTKIIAAHRSVEGTAYNFGAGTVTRMTGMQFAGGCHSTGPITTLNIVNLATYGPGAGITGTVNGLSISNLALYNTPTTVYAINIDASTTVVGTLKYGLYIGNQAGATTNYSIYTAGGACLLNAGAATVVPLTIKGASGQSGNLLQLQPSTGSFNHVEFDADGDLTITKDDATSFISQIVYKTASGYAPQFIGKRACGTLALPTPIESGLAMNQLSGYGWDGTDWILCGRIGILSSTLHALTPTAEGGTRIKFFTIKEGDATRALEERLVIDEAGNIAINHSGLASVSPGMTGGLSMKLSTPPTTCGTDIVTLYTKDANAAAGYSWWHGMGEKDAEHVIGAVLLHSDTGDPTVSHEAAMSINYGDDCVGIVKNAAWSRFLMTNVVSYDDDLIFYDDEVVWN